MKYDHQLVPEWHPQEAVILAWPDVQTDWAPWLTDVTATYLAIIDSINRTGAGVILLVRKSLGDDVRQRLSARANVLLVEADYNDTWVRDYAFVTCQQNGRMQPIEFVFNGWGNKFHAAKDDAVNQAALASLCQAKLQSVDFVMEGGAIEIDDNGTLLSTELCLQNPERNGDMSLDAYRTLFNDTLGASRSVILRHGHLEGDDTDGHVDTLVRFAPEHSVVVQSCNNRPDDSHYVGLRDLVDEVGSYFPQHVIYQLPLPQMYSEDGARLPASYANYLICNQHVICPIYQQPEDEQALAVLRTAYPDFKIIPINASSLVQQFGSIHCITMQVPQGTLKPEVIQQLNRGVSLYGA